MKDILVFLLLVCLILILFQKENPERFQESSSNKFKGSVHVRGNLNILSDKDTKIKFDKLMIKDSLTGLVGSIDSQKLAYLVNNKDHRLKLFCLGNTCIGRDHLNILNGNGKFKIKDLKENQCLSTIGNKYIHWRESYKYIQHDDDDDAKFQIIHNPVTFKECDEPSNVNFNLNTIETESDKDSLSNKETIQKSFERNQDKHIRNTGIKNIGLSI